MKFAESCKLLCRRPSLFISIFRAGVHRMLVGIWYNSRKYLRLLAVQILLVPVAIFLKVTGRLEGTPADAITVGGLHDVVRLGIIGVLAVIAVAGVALLSLVWWYSWIEFCRFAARQDAQETFLAAKLEWPWCNVSTTVEGRSGQEERQYSYEPVGKGDIRLLRVFRVGNKAEFEGELVHMSFEKRHPKYLAVSYTWDDSSAYSKVHFGNKGFLHVTKSVHVILETLLAPGDDCIHLWIDGLCINQEDKLEKSAQVLLMRKVYSHAQQVIICLGRATFSSNQGMDSIVPLHEAFRSISRGLYGSSQVSKFMMADLAKAGFDLPEAYWLGLTELLSRRWWNRVWVIQEVAVGVDPIIICGDRAVKWDVMASVITRVLTEGTLMRVITANPADPNSPLTQPVKAATHITQMSSARNRLSLDKLPSFQDTLMEMVGYDATDELDKVYGLLGLSRDQEDVELKPDYSLSARMVYISTARHLLTSKNSLLILHRAGMKPPRDVTEESTASKEDVPSWVPDWQPRPTSEDRLCFAKGWAQYRASGTYSPQVASPSENVLVVRGVIVDFVQQVSTLKGEQEQILQSSHELHTRAKPTAKESDTRLFDLEDERKITTRWVSEHKSMMERLRTKKHPGDAALATPWKDEYERTILAADPCAFSRAPIESEFNRIWISAACMNFTKMAVQIPCVNDLQTAEDATLFHQRFMTASKGRRFFTTSRGRVGLGELCTAQGDVVVVFLGASTPFIIREVPARKGCRESEVKIYRLVGEAYVDGLMAGEGVEGLQKGTVKARNIHLC